MFNWMFNIGSYWRKNRDCRFDGSCRNYFNALDVVSKETGVTFAFQGCEHINRAITIEKSQFNPLTMEEVSVIPDVHAGGSLATYAFQHMKDPIVVEHITVPCGIDIGQTLIGMHIKHVCVPVRTSVKQVGQAIVTIATSRPKRLVANVLNTNKFFERRGDFMSYITKQDKVIAEAIEREFQRQNSNIELIASENFVSEAVMEAQGSVLTNKYAEGYPGRRYYGGCEFVDVTESIAIDRAKALFGAEHVNVQPHSGSQANMAVYLVALEMGDTVLGMNLSHGGHLTHGAPVNFSGKFYNFVEYGVDKDTERINYDEVRKLALEHKPKLIVAGASAYSRTIDFKKFKEIADEVNAKLMVDMAHIAGLVAAGLHPNPVEYADFVTTTTHKTLRGPRGGMILCKEEYKKT